MPVEKDKKFEICSGCGPTLATRVVERKNGWVISESDEIMDVHCSVAKLNHHDPVSNE